MKDIIFFWAPGAGKGTQVELLLAKLWDQVSWLSTGDVFRAIVSKPNAIGKYVEWRMNSGKLINDQVTMSLFNAYFFTVIDDKKYMVLDGYPRTLVQLDSLMALCKENKREVLGIFFDLPEEESIKRIVWRGREGEDQSVIQKRMQEYNTLTKPIVDAFAKHGTLITVDARPSIEEIHGKVMEIVM